MCVKLYYVGFCYEVKSIILNANFKQFFLYYWKCMCMHAKFHVTKNLSA